MGGDHVPAHSGKNMAAENKMKSSSQGSRSSARHDIYMCRYLVVLDVGKRRLLMWQMGYME